MYLHCIPCIFVVSYHFSWWIKIIRTWQQELDYHSLKTTGTHWAGFLRWNLFWLRPLSQAPSFRRIQFTKCGSCWHTTPEHLFSTFCKNRRVENADKLHTCVHLITFAECVKCWPSRHVSSYWCHGTILCRTTSKIVNDYLTMLCNV